MTFEQAFQHAVQHHQSGRLVEADAIYRQLLSLQPGHHPSLHLRGVLAHQVGKHDVALQHIQQAVAAAENISEYHSNLSMVFAAIGQFEQAVASARQAIGLAPDFANAHVNLGYSLAILGLADQAIASFRTAIQLHPNHVSAHDNLGKTLQRQGLLEEATAAFRTAVQLAPNQAHLHNSLGVALDEQGKSADAVAAFRKAVSVNPQFTEALNNLALALHGQHLYDQAIDVYRNALKFEPSNPRILSNLGNAYRDVGDLDAALPLLRQAADLSPTEPTPHSNLIYAMHFQPGVDQTAILIEERRWKTRYAMPITPLEQPQHNRDPDRKLRIGYVSPDFRDHCQSFFTLSLLRNHDHTNFEIFCYSSVFRPDSMTAEIKRHVDQWRDISRLSDRQAAEIVRQDNIDILIDLTLHMSANRLLLFAHKPAPVQITWLGYPGGTGLNAIGYRFTDQYLDPPDMDQARHVEQSIRLPNSFWCYDPLSEEPSVGSLPAMRNGYVTFGCMNSFSKVNSDVLSLWATVLLKVPNARMLILADAGQHRQKTLDAFLKLGIEAHRITFESERPRRQYLQLYNQIDISLDTSPYTGHTTTLDSLWMGVPVVTWPGSTAVSRGTLSILKNVGLPEWIATSRVDYAEIATTAASNLPLLKSIRATLRDQLRASPLMDAPQFTRDFERQLRMLWQCYCAASEK